MLKEKKKVHQLAAVTDSVNATVIKNKTSSVEGLCFQAGGLSKFGRRSVRI